MVKPEWIQSLKTYEGGDNRNSVFQLLFTLLPYLLVMTIMALMVMNRVPYLTVLLMAVPAAGLLVRLFIIMHDCGHNSFFKNRTATSLTGKICGFLTFTPFEDWRRSHAIHHASVSNLDKRGTGDVWTMTVQEYKQSSFVKKIIYRIFRNPLFLFLPAPVFSFLILQRLPHKNMNRKDRHSILLTDLSLVILVLFFTFTIGLPVYIKVQLPVIFLASMFGLWLFFIQHQYKQVYWAHTENWDSIKAAMEGSSYYRLPAVLQWFSGNIGYHHIHHLDPRIPNYKLQKCFNEIAETRNINAISLAAGFKSVFLKLWDEKSRVMVGYRFLKQQSLQDR